MNKQPRQHQIDAIQAAAIHFDNNNNGLMQMACGSGKTLTSLWIAEKLNAKNIIVALPSLQLQAQTVGTWIVEAVEFNLKMIVIGSDKSIGEIFGIQVTTDSKEIADFFLKNKAENKIVFTTYQSTNTLIEACEETNTVFDFGIIDEAHETAGNDAKLFGKILFDDNGIIIKKRLFMTATPKFFDDDRLVSMNDKEIYGEIFYRLPTEKAIELGILCDYKLLVIYLDEHESLNYTNKQRMVKVGTEKVPRRYLGINEFLRKSTEKYEMKKIVSFHKSVDLAKSFYSLVKDSNNALNVFNIDNSVKMKERFRILDDFKSTSPALITNPRILIQGYDLPEIDAVLWADISTNQFQITQGNGRALRRHESKKMGYVLCPIFVNKNGVVNKKEYDALSKALSNMVASDSRLNHYFAKKATTENDDEEKDIINVVDYTEKVNKSVIELLSKNLSVRIWNRTKVLQYLSWDDFVTTVRELCPPMGISSRAAYTKWSENDGTYPNRFPTTIPVTPESVYSEYWEGWDKLFQKRGQFDIMPYQEAHEIAKDVCSKYGICSSNAMFKWKKGLLPNTPTFPERMAISPDKSYQEFTSWTDFFGIESRERHYLSYDEAKQWATSQKFKNRAEFYQNPRPINVPSNPEKIYKSEWNGWDEFLGKEKSKKKAFISYQDAKEWVKNHLLPLGIDSFSKYFDWLKNRQDILEKPKGLPTSPNKIYADEWEGWDVFFGKEKYYKDYSLYKIVFLDKEKNKVKEFDTALEAATFLGFDEKYIFTSIQRKTLVKRMYFIEFEEK